MRTIKRACSTIDLEYPNLFKVQVYPNFLFTDYQNSKIKICSKCHGNNLSLLRHGEIYPKCDQKYPKMNRQDKSSIPCFLVWG